MPLRQWTQIQTLLWHKLSKFAPHTAAERCSGVAGMCGIVWRNIMDIQTLTAFFMWCTIINVALFAWAAIWFMLAPDFIYRMQSKFFPLPRETYNVVIYAFLGVFKIVIMAFNVAPWVALLIVA